MVNPAPMTACHLVLFHPEPPKAWLESVAHATGARGIERLGNLGFRLNHVANMGAVAEALGPNQPERLDWALIPADRQTSDFRMLVCDMDGTLIVNECVDELAGLLPDPAPVRELTAAAMRGEMSVEESLRRRIEALSGLPERALRVVAERLHVRPGADRLMRRAHQAGWPIVLLTGGFSVFAQPIARSLGVDHVLCNTLDMIDGRLAGTFSGNLVDGSAKARALFALATGLGIRPDQIVALGDGANDLETLSAAGLSIGIEPKPLIAEIVDAQLWHTPLDAVWHIAGGN